MSTLDVLRLVTLGLVLANLVVLVLLRVRYPRQWRYLILPGVWLVNLLVYLVYLFMHRPLSAEEIAIVNMWSSALRIQALMSLFGAGVVYLWRWKFIFRS